MAVKPDCQPLVLGLRRGLVPARSPPATPEPADGAEVLGPSRPRRSSDMTTLPVSDLGQGEAIFSKVHREPLRREEVLLKLCRDRLLPAPWRVSAVHAARPGEWNIVGLL